jgi:hypothetical protein
MSPMFRRHRSLWEYLPEMAFIVGCILAGFTATWILALFLIGD